MKELQKVTLWLEGKKTYAFSIATAVQGLYTYFIQHGSNLHTLVSYLLFGGGLAALRAGIKKV